MKDSYGKTWDCGGELDDYIRRHKLHLEINYENEPGIGTYFHLIVKSKKETLINFKDYHPLNDSEILSWLKENDRDKKINLLLDDE